MDLMLEQALRNLPVEFESDPAFKALKENPALLIQDSFDEAAKLFLQFRGISSDDNPEARLAKVMQLLKSRLGEHVTILRQDDGPETRALVRKFERLIRHLPPDES
jgi:hypothetical protein